MWGGAVQHFHTGVSDTDGRLHNLPTSSPTEQEGGPPEPASLRSGGGGARRDCQVSLGLCVNGDGWRVESNGGCRACLYVSINESVHHSIAFERVKSIPPLCPSPLLTQSYTHLISSHTNSVATWTTESILDFLSESLPPASEAGKSKKGKGKKDKGSSSHEEL